MGIPIFVSTRAPELDEQVQQDFETLLALGHGSADRQIVIEIVQALAVYAQSSASPLGDVLYGAGQSIEAASGCSCPER